MDLLTQVKSVLQPGVRILPVNMRAEHEGVVLRASTGFNPFLRSDLMPSRPNTITPRAASTRPQIIGRSTVSPVGTLAPTVTTNTTTSTRPSLLQGIDLHEFSATNSLPTTATATTTSIRTRVAASNTLSPAAGILSPDLVDPPRKLRRRQSEGACSQKNQVFKTMRVLVVDDSIINCRIMVSFFFSSTITHSVHLICIHCFVYRP
jgi:hypothetical protein